jgi:hypothetical protein
LRASKQISYVGVTELPFPQFSITKENNVDCGHALDGSAYLNAGFMQQYDAKGTPVRISWDSPTSVTLQPLDQRGSF